MSATTADSVLEAARDVAFAAAQDEAGTAGDYVTFVMEAEGVGTHYFACTSPAYPGWQWAVTVSRVADDSTATVCEVVLLPGDTALVAPPWIPWSARVRPGDLGVGDVLPTAPDDPRLAPGYTGEGDREALESEGSWLGWFMGLGRPRVLSREGRDLAADRWDAGDFGPHAEMAQASTMNCASCGFLLTIGGPLGQAFGVCAHPLSPADGRMVSLAYGCGAHSERMVEQVPTSLTPGEEAEARELGHS